MSFDLPFPILWIIGFLIIATTLALWLYLFNQSFRIPQNRKIFLAVLRFFLLFTLLFLLLSPLFKFTRKETIKPIFAILVDASQSMIKNRDSSLIKKEIPEFIQDLQSSLTDYDVRIYSFSDSLRNNFKDFSGKITNISDALLQLRQRLQDNWLSEVLLISDGIYNMGANPILMASQLPFPVHCMAVGDTTPSIDLSVSFVQINKEVGFNAYFPIEISVNAHGASGKSSVIKVFLNDKKISEQNLFIASPAYSKFISLQELATQKGLNKITVIFDPLPEEKNKNNNVVTVYFNVIEKTKNILIFAETIHPDIRSIKEALEHYAQFSVDVFRKEEVPTINLDKYNLVIYYQSPQSPTSPPLFQEITQRQIPVWFIGGMKFNYHFLMSQKTGINIKIRSNNSNEVFPAFNSNFSLFTMPENEKSFFDNLPPLELPFGEYSAGTTSQIMLFQKHGKVVTQQPLLLFNKWQNVYFAYLLGEGIWQWRIKAFVDYQSHDIFDQFIARIVQFLTEHTEKSRFLVKYKTNYSSFELVQMTAELYNTQYELINDIPIVINIKDSNNRIMTYQFEPEGNAYSLSLQGLPSGIYQFTASVQDNRYPFKQSGQFSINAFNPELLSLKANYNLLKQIAELTGGDYFQISSKKEWLAKIQQKTPSTREKKITRYASLIEWPYIFFLLLLLATIEWGWRKWEGYY
ncbi:MAG: VWA domain-containing protein [Bacteroidales bacterium]|nr:VWA domain-containing protein [Bacteroidales bacterium]